ncbi:hypothetical protein ATY75_24425 [Rhizobium sp. N122]|uniref:hypothetical protein n=1 Tax=Rhizobium sp. N122 TaxID=1764272 RepID=UPI000B5AB0CA|nr:hypothetical protein [Rhizobium sp. N122]OWV85667.1 hypothetical protein ATY75_24425 [Rhizobium sp. N122]
MKILGWAYSRNTGHTHEVANYPIGETDIEIDSDGNVRVKLISKEISLTGQYVLSVRLTPGEIEMIHSELKTGDLKKRLEKLEERLGEPD